jgi:autotransporter-associated beta strand protein
MKRTIRTKSLLLGATLLGSVLFATLSTQAADITQTASQTAGQNWTITASWGGALPSAGNNYITPSPMDVRTPDSQVASTFAGDQLQINAGARLILKNGGANAGTANAKLVMNGGSITFNTANLNTISAVGGTLQVAANSTINSVAGAATRNIWLRSTLSGSANLTVGMVNSTNFLVLFGTNTAFSGNWTVNSGGLEISTNAVNALGSGSVLLANVANSLVFNGTNDFTVTNVIDGFGAMVKANANTVTLGGNNPLAGATVISNGVLRLNHAGAVANVQVITLAGGTLDASPIGGLVLNAGNSQSLHCRGAVVGSLTAAAGNALNFNLTPTTNDILNVTGALTLSGNPTLNLTLAGFKPAGTYRLINYSGTIQGGGAFDLVPPSGSSQIFQLDTSTPGQVNLIITGLSQNLTWVGDGSGNYWDTTSPNWSGGTGIFAIGDNVTFTDTGSAVPDIYVPGAVIPNHMVVSNTAQPYLIYGEGISTFATLTKAGANVLTFTSPGNNFTGAVDIRAGTLSIGGGGGFGTLGAPLAVTNNGLLRVNLASGGITINAPISGSGAVEVTGGGASLTINGTNSYTGLTTIDNECQLNISTSNALGTLDAGTLVLANGRLGVASFVGDLTVAEPLTVNGVGITAAPGALYVNTVNNNVTYSGPVTLASDARFRVVNVNARMNFSNPVLGNNVALWCTAGNAAADTATAINFLNTFSIGSGALTKDGQGIVAFNSLNNTCGSVIINGGTVQANGLLNGGPVTVNATGALGGSGTNAGPVTVLPGGSIAPGRAGIGTLTLNSTLSLDAAAVTAMEINRTNAQNADKLVAAAIPLNGTLTVVNVGPALQLGDTFALFNGALSGNFSAANLPAFSQPNYIWDTSLLASQGIIKVTTNSLALLPLTITDIKLNSTNVVLTWNSYPGQLYTFEYSTNLLNWNVAESGIAATAGTNSSSHALSLIQPPVGNNVTLVQYQMGTAEAQVQNATTLMAAGSLTQGPGLIGATWIPNAAALGYASGPVLQVSSASVDFATATANQAWFTFTLTVGSGVTDLDLASLSFNGARGGGSTPRGYGVYVTTPTTTDELVQGTTDFVTARPTWAPQNISLAGIASLQNLTSGQEVTFKIAVYTPATGSSVEFDDLTIKGNIAPGLLPTYAGGNKLFLRVKQQ